MSVSRSEVDFHFDPMCPFAYQTSLWIREVRDQLGVTVHWRFFSLEEVNRFDGKKHPWERAWSYGWSLMRIGALLRRQSMALLDSWYATVGRELHVLGGKPHDPEVARRLLTGLGLAPEMLDEALADDTTHDEVRADHQRVLDAGGFGVPTLFLLIGSVAQRQSSPDRQCLFGPVLVDPPTGEDAVRLWHVITGMADFPHVYEIQRPKAPADQALIAERLQPYLTGRDWVSVNRGQVIDLGSPA
jgi:2-hydroxychromene-2-carboxylate isomerase